MSAITKNTKAMFEDGECESTIRSRARRQGLLLKKCRSRDPQNYLYGTFMLIDADRNIIVLSDHAYGRGFGCTLEECAEFLEGRES